MRGFSATTYLSATRDLVQAYATHHVSESGCHFSKSFQGKPPKSPDGPSVNPAAAQLNAAIVKDTDGGNLLA
jgi:hypothetical protein